MAIRSFKDLVAWQKSKDLAICAYKLTSAFPRNEQFGLTSQIRRAANSIPANIAEGFSRRTLKDQENFYNIAHGSLQELDSHFLIAYELDLIAKDQYQKVAQQLNETGRLIGGLLRKHRSRYLNS